MLKAFQRQIEREHPRPLHREGLWSRMGPFVMAGVISVGLVPVRFDTHSPFAWIALALAPCVVGLAYVLPWRRWPAGAQAILPLLGIPMVAFVRDATGRSASPMTVLFLLPVLWFALYGTRRELSLSLVCLEAAFIIPIMLGGSGYPLRDLATAFQYIVLGTLLGFAVQRLVHELEDSRREFRRLARADPLTGVGNRRVWEERLTLELARSGRSGEPLTMAIVDLDRFKELNDKDGHDAGDLLLKAATAAWQAALRTEDLIVRLGGDEFALLFPSCHQKEGLQVLARLAVLVPGDHTCSIGVVQWDGFESCDNLMRRADEALYAAKESGRNRIEAG
jgi:diguanylate cyclase (GGDEF)-like protein